MRVREVEYVLFNSFEYLFVFLPLTWASYFLLQKLKMPQLAGVFLVAASFGFYSWWNPAYFPLLLGSIIFNFMCGRLLTTVVYGPAQRQALLLIGIVANLGLLGFYKYKDFFLANVNWLCGTDFAYGQLLLPLGISFFTFQQLAYIIDCYRNQAPLYKLFPYALFVSFFPQLIAGPIVHHREMLHQFQQAGNRRVDSGHVSAGLYVLAMGLFKKVIMADSLAHWVSFGFNAPAELGLLEGWIVSLAYSLQLYFDFSGYTDMATGTALMFNIRLPANFNSPYKAASIQDFWRRWHMTLGRFLRDYLYIPLGGSRGSQAATTRNLLITFFLAGLWHGAGWTFVLWGCLHGLALVVHRGWNLIGWSLPKWLGVLLTFNFVNLAWVLFRAPDFQTAWAVIQAMFGGNGMSGSLFAGAGTGVFLNFADVGTAMACVVSGLLICWFSKNSLEKREAFKPNALTAVTTAAMLVLSAVNLLEVSEFLYFNF